MCLYIMAEMPTSGNLKSRDSIFGITPITAPSTQPEYQQQQQVLSNAWTMKISSQPADMWISIVKKKTDFIMDIVICK